MDQIIDRITARNRVQPSLGVFNLTQKLHVVSFYQLISTLLFFNIISRTTFPLSYHLANAREEAKNEVRSKIVLDMTIQVHGSDLCSTYRIHQSGSLKI